MSKLSSFNLSDKIGFVKQTVIRDREGRALHNDKSVNPTRGYNILQIKAITKGAPNYIKQILTEIRREIAIQ